MSSSGARGLFALLLVVSGVAATVAVVPTAASPADSTNASSSYALEDLRNDGQQIGGAAPSMRWYQTARMDEALYIDYQNSNPLRRSGGDESYQADELLEAGSTVDVNTLTIHSQGGGLGERTHTLHIVYWQTRVVNESGTETVVATNVSETTTQVTFSRAFDTAEIDLRNNPEKYQVTMWLEGSESARWRFAHQSRKTSAAVSTDTAGERLWWLISNYALWVLGFGFLIFGGVFLAKKKAGAGPQLGTLTWAFGLSILGGGLLLFAYDSVADLFVDAPKLLALATVLLLAIPVLEGETHLSKWLFLKPELLDATSAAGEDAKDAAEALLDERTVVRMPDGDLAVVEPGLLKFFARLFGEAAHLEGQSEIAMEMRTTGSKHDQIIFADPEGEEALDYDSEGWTFDPPTTMSGLLPLGAVATALALVGGGLFDAAWIGAAALPLLSIRPAGGEARLEGAVGHTRPAFVTMMYGAREFDQAKTLAEARERIVREVAKNERDVEQALDRRDTTLLEELLGQGREFDPRADGEESLEGESSGKSKEVVEKKDSGLGLGILGNGTGGEDD